MSHILDPFNADKDNLEKLFEKLYSQNTILFLGAGAAVTDKKYLSSQIIDYYKNKTGQQYDTNDIVEFVDMMSSSTNFRRKEFDDFVQSLLVTLKPQDYHRTILSIKWRQIITTNYDLLLEQAEQEIRDTSAHAFKLVPVRRIQEYEYFENRDQVKYLKLNGCLSDKSKYPFVFSSDDFRRANSFYKKALNPLKNLSPDTNFLSVGYSYTDPLGKLLLEKFDNYNFRDGKSMYCIDPYVQDYRLDFFAKNRVIVIKATADEFFREYKSWEIKKYANKQRTLSLGFSESDNQHVSLNSKLAYNLSQYITQLNSSYSGIHMSEKDFYMGEEPNYLVIRKGFDIVKKAEIDLVKRGVLQLLTSKNDTILPIVFLTGTFGTGKTTFNYRLIHEIINQPDNNTIAFELIDPESVSRENILDLIRSIKSKNIIFYCNRIEVDSIFKSILDLRLQISMQQIPDKSVCFVLSIRENILEKYKRKSFAGNLYESKVDASLSREEVEDLVDRLNTNMIVTVRDTYEKNQLVNKIIKEYQGDTFLSMLNLVSNGKHIRDLREAYEELSATCQDAFIYTALLHRHNLLMPSGLLKELVASDWNDFLENVIKVEGKGILIQEAIKSKGVDPDLYFRTKHPQIADRLINDILKSSDKRYKSYVRIINNIPPTNKSSRLIVDLLKSMKDVSEFGDSQVSKLYDHAHRVFDDEPYFLLHYAIDLQYRKTIEMSKKAISTLIYAESLLSKRNHKFIHRRAILNFELAKKYFDSENELSQTYVYLDEAKDLFSLKQQLDPSSSYSYYDYISLLIWELDNVKMDDDEELLLKIEIEDNFTLALNAISDGVNRIQELEGKYIQNYQYQGDASVYLQKLEELYEDTELRPFACILLFNFYSRRNDSEQNRNELLEELWFYKDLQEVSIFLFREYGRRLYNQNHRAKFFETAKDMDWYQSSNPLRYNYFMYVAEAYNRNFKESVKYMIKIQDMFPVLNPEFNLNWMDNDGENKREFEGHVVKVNRFIRFRSKEFQKNFRFDRENYVELAEGDNCKIHLRFYLTGIKAVLQKAQIVDNTIENNP